MAAMVTEPQPLTSIFFEKARMGVGLRGEAHLESILKADSSLRMLAALSTKWLPPRDACCMAELYLPSAAAANHLSTCGALQAWHRQQPITLSYYGNI